MASPMTAPRSETPRLEFADDLPRQESRAFRYGREAASLVLIAGAVFLTLALASFSHDPAVSEVTGTNWVGPVGEALANVFVSTLGLAAWIIPVELVLISLPLFRNKPTMASVARIGGDTVVILIVASLIHVSFPQSTAFGSMSVGGTIGELFGELMRSLFSNVGSYLIGLTAIGLVLIARASFSFISFAQRAGQTTEHAAMKSAEGLRAIKHAWHRARTIEKVRAEHGAIRITTADRDDAIVAIDTEVEAARERALAKATEIGRAHV